MTDAARRSSDPPPQNRTLSHILTKLMRIASRGRHVLAVLVLIGLGLKAHLETIDYGLLGFDSYMQIMAARIQSWDDFFGTFAETLTNGSIEARFYRPVQNLSIALDYALWDVEPFGYHLHTLTCFAICIFLVYATVRRILGPGAWIGPVVAAAFFTLHPCLLNVLPVAARRSELLMVGFLLVILLILPTRPVKREWLRYGLAGVLVMVAAGAKDIGVMGLGLVFLHYFLFHYRNGLINTAWRAWLASLPAFVGATIYMINRTLVLQGFGGYPERDDETLSYLGKVQHFGGQLLVDLFCPWVFLPSSWLPQGWANREIAITIFATLLVIALLLVLGSWISRNSERKRTGVLLVLGLAWLVPPAIVIGLMNFYGPWYATIPMAGCALLVGAFAHAASLLLRGRWFERPLGVVPALTVCTVLLFALFKSPLHTLYTEWMRETERTNKTLRSLDRQMEQAPLGTSIYVRPNPWYEDPDPPSDRPLLRWVAGPYVKGLIAYARLKYPEKNPRARSATYMPGQDDADVRPDEVLVRVRPVSFQVHKPLGP